MIPTGRFAPSPTGDLHFGSLIAAVASYLEAKSRGGRWLVRVDDIDPPREVPGSADRILQALQSFGMRSDGPVLFQSTRTEAYRVALQTLLNKGLAFHCGCTRSELPASGIYPGTCRNGLPPGKSPRAVRLTVNKENLKFTDRIQGEISERLSETCGDFVIWRADGLPAYQLAVVVDDAWQGVTEIVRGCDLLGSTARQVHVARCLGLDVPAYAHHPVAASPGQHKLSKRLGSDPIDHFSRSGALEKALRFLGQPAPGGLPLDELWEWALENWNMGRVPARERVEIGP